MSDNSLTELEGLKGLQRGLSIHCLVGSLSIVARADIAAVRLAAPATDSKVVPSSRSSFRVLQNRSIFPLVWAYKGGCSECFMPSSLSIRSMGWPSMFLGEAISGPCR